MPALDAILHEKIAALDAKRRLRTLVATERGEGLRVWRNGRELLNFSGNDYLDLSRHPAVVETAKEALSRYGAGAGASRLVTGDHPLYEVLETALSRYKNAEAACVFGSGYLANIGAISALMGRDDVVIADRLVHACILDGIRLSGAKLLRFSHNDAADCGQLLETHRKRHAHCLVITETVFSMDGDTAPLVELRRLCDKHDAWLMVDDAHGFGLEQPVKADVTMGTLSKAIGGYGGYVCGSAALVTYLKTVARSFMFSTALPPATVAAATAALSIMEQEPERCRLPLERARLFTRTLGLPEAESAIVPLMLDNEESALAAAARLEEAGFLVVAIRPPTVPEGMSRLRFTFSAGHAESDIIRLCEVVNHACISA